MRMTQADFAKVDLGADHNGRVAWRRVFKMPNGDLCIVDRGRKVPVRRISRSVAGLNYVTWKREDKR